MSDIKIAVELIREGQHLWDQERMDDALAVFYKATEIAPNLPDPWIDIAALLRAKNHQHKNEQLELKALDADRKLVELGKGISDLIVEITLATHRISYREIWDKHLRTHLQQEVDAERIENEAKLKLKNEKEAEIAKKRESNSVKYKKLVAERERALQKAKRAFYKSLSFIEKRQLKKNISIGGYPFDPNHPEAVRARFLQQQIEQLQDEIYHIGRVGERFRHDYVMQNPSEDQMKRSNNKLTIQFLIDNFDASMHKGSRCICGVSLNDDPPS